MDKSYWIDSSMEKRKDYAKLQEEINTEITIIGGGLTGLTTAYYLTKEGKDVAVLEKNRICSHTSGNTTGKITSQHGIFYNYLVQSLGKEAALQYLMANEMAIKNIKKIIDDEKIDCDFDMQDAYIFAQSEEGLQKLRKEQDALEYLGFNKSDLQEKIDLKIKEKDLEDTNHLHIQKKVLGALRFKEQAQFNAYLYGLALAEKIEERKGKIFENSKVIDVKKVDDGYEIITEDGKINSKIVIIASHYPIINFPGFYFLKMYQETSYLIAIETNAELFDGMYINAENETISLRTATYGDRRIVLIGGQNHKTGAKIDLRDCYKRLEEVANELYPGCKVLYRWNTEDCITLDKIPYIGEFSNLWPNVYVGTGYKKWGMTSSNVAANIITDKILGRDNLYEEVFTSTRLKPIKNYKELGNMLKEVAYSEVINKIRATDEHIKDIKQGEAKIVDIEGKKVGIYRDEEGKLCAIKPYCTHLGCELSWNNLDKTWDCPCHGSRFTVDGKSIYDPSIKDLKLYYIDK